MFSLVDYETIPFHFQGQTYRVWLFLLTFVEQQANLHIVVFDKHLVYECHI